MVLLMKKRDLKKPSAWKQPSKYCFILSVIALTGCVYPGAKDQSPTQSPDDGAVSAQQRVIYRFASTAETGAILSTEDEYTAELQPAEIGIKNRDGSKTAFADLQANYQASTLAWTDAERDLLTQIISDIRPAIEAYEPHLPAEVLLGKISDGVEGGLPHTRANLILFSEAPLNAYWQTAEGDPETARRDLTSLFLHELHHIMSRYNRDRHDDYFALIGFAPCDFTEPPALRSHRLTNPDAPAYKHYAPVTLENGNGVIPFLKITEPYNTAKGGALGSYFNFGLLAVTVENNTCTIAGDEPRLLSPAAVPGFFSLIGQNTGYIIHPEETLADNFTYLILERDNLPNPEIPEKIRTFWTGNE